jgi:hypothetical protein
MRGVVAALLVAGMLIIWAVSVVRAGDSGADEREIAPGVRYRFIERPEGPWRIHLVTVDLTTPGISLRSVRAHDRLHGRETVSSMVKRFPAGMGKVLAAVNADFFSLETGETANNQILETEWVKGIGGKHRRPRSQFGMLESGRPVIDRLMFEGSVLSPDGASDPLHAVNIPPDTASFALYNHFAGRPLADHQHEKRMMISLARCADRADTIVAVVGMRCTRRDSLWLVAWSGTVAERRMKRWMPGDTIRVAIGSQPPRRTLRTLVGGAPRIVVAGRNVAGMKEWMEGTSEGFSSRRHPRTGVGFSADSTRLVLFAVDGRQESSDGMTLPEFAQLMIGQGVAEGVNLDGGGSTVMVVDGEVVNTPSDPTGEREVANALLLVADPLAKQTH